VGAVLSFLALAAAVDLAARLSGLLVFWTVTEEAVVVVLVVVLVVEVDVDGVVDRDFIADTMFCAESVGVTDRDFDFRSMSLRRARCFKVRCMLSTVFIGTSDGEGIRLLFGLLFGMRWPLGLRSGFSVFNLVAPKDDEDDVTVILRAVAFVDFGIGITAEDAVPFEVDGAVFGIRLLFRFLRTAGLCADGLIAAFLVITAPLELEVDDVEAMTLLFAFILR